MQQRFDYNAIGVYLFAAASFLPWQAVVPAFFYLVVHTACSAAVRRRIVSTRGFWPITAFCALAVANGFIFGSTLNVLVALAIAGLFLVMFYLRAVITERVFENALVILLLGLVSLFGAIAQYIKYDFKPGFRPKSFYLNPNYYAMGSAFTMLAALYRLLKTPNQRLLSLFGLLLAVVNIVLAGSRGALAGAAMAALVVAFFCGHKRAVGLVFGALAAGGLVIALNPSLFRMNSLLDSFSIRVDDWTAAISGIKETPILGQGAVAFPRLAGVAVLRGDLHSHSLYLEVLLIGGVVGLVLVSLFAFRFFGGTAQYARPLMLGLAVYIVIHGLVDVTIATPQTIVQLAVLLAPAAAFAGPPETKTDA